MKFLIDMNLSPGWVPFLEQEHFEAIHWSDVGPGTASDADVMSWAGEHNCVVITADLDFGSILAATEGRKPSVIQLRGNQATPSTIGNVLLECIQTAHEELAGGALISLDTRRARLRILPLRQT
jgi:predicted nuclease of predicted toxin-antitoxin system